MFLRRFSANRRDEAEKLQISQQFHQKKGFSSSHTLSPLLFDWEGSSSVKPCLRMLLLLVVYPARTVYWSETQHPLSNYLTGCAARSSPL
jgi:hypothetical protein